jgi:hypothetical protein
VRVFRALHLRLGTRKAYGNHQRKFARLCASIGVDHLEPLSEATLCKAAVDFCMTCKVTSLPQYFAAIQKLHDNNGHGPLPRGAAYKQTCKGLLNFFGQVDKVEPKHALTLENLTAILGKLSMLKFEDVCFWATLITAFFGLLRISEYSSGALQQRHVRVADEGVILSIPFSKTDLMPVEVRLSARDDHLCPRRAVTFYQLFVGKASAESKAPFFLANQKSLAPLTKAKFIAKLKQHVAEIGLDPAHYSGHSLRRGGCTAMFLAGVNETFIAAHGRWRSLAYRKYLDFVDETQWRPTALLAKAGLNLLPAAAAAQRVLLPGSDPGVGRR